MHTQMPGVDVAARSPAEEPWKRVRVAIDRTPLQIARATIDPIASHRVLICMMSPFATGIRGKR
jgi:hypothetical protein